MRVVVRIRPGERVANAAPVARPLRTVVHPTSATTLQVEPSTVPAVRDTRHAFAFDQVFGPAASQADVYASSVEPLVHRFLEGYNATVFAYGQTSSGKSYSMGTVDEGVPLDVGGDAETAGIVPRATEQIFAALDAKAAEADASAAAGAPRTEYTLQVSFLELYNEDLLDLLADAPEDARSQVQIRENRGGQILWTGLRQVRATSREAVLEALQQGMGARQTHETHMNVHSSRSHAIFSLTLTAKRWRASAPGAPRVGTPTLPSTPRAAGRPSALPTRGMRTPGAETPVGTPPRPGAGRSGAPAADCTVTTSKLHFVDLAGSERLKRTAATGERAREGISINSGLHALGNVISTLSDPVRGRRATHIPYRDSKLTRLLQDSLGGNSHTLMIACVSPIEANASETLNTLQYAQRARSIRNSVELNQTELGWDNVEYLQTQVLRLRKQLELVRSSHALITDDAPVRAPGAAGAAPGAAEQELLEWQRRYSALSHKNVQLTAELVQLDRQQAQRGRGAAPDTHFLEAAEPVIEEYEKTVDSLEGQISVLNATLAQTEELLREREEQLAQAREQSAQDARELGIVRASMRDLHERLDDRVRRVEELEAQLRQQRGTPPAHLLAVRRGSASFSSDEPAVGSPTRRSHGGGVLEYYPSTPGRRGPSRAPPTPVGTSDTSGDASFQGPDPTLDLVAAAERELHSLNDLLSMSAGPKQDRKIRGEYLDRLDALLQYVCLGAEATNPQVLGTEGGRVRQPDPGASRGERKPAAAPGRVRGCGAAGRARGKRAGRIAGHHRSMSIGHEAQTWDA